MSRIELHSNRSATVSLPVAGARPARMHEVRPAMDARSSLVVMIAALAFTFGGPGQARAAHVGPATVTFAASTGASAAMAGGSGTGVRLASLGHETTSRPAPRQPQSGSNVPHRKFRKPPPRVLIG